MVEPVIGLAQPYQHRSIEPVLRFRPVDADQQHAAAPFHQYISRLCRTRRSGRRWSRLRKRGAATSKVYRKCGCPGTGNNEISTRNAGGCCTMAVDHELSPGGRELVIPRIAMHCITMSVKQRRP